MLADVYQMVTNVYPMVAEASSVANPQKMKKISKMEQTLVGNTALDLQPMNYLIPQLTSVIWATLGFISYPWAIHW